MLWQTDELRVERPEVEDEIRLDPALLREAPDLLDPRGLPRPRRRVGPEVPGEHPEPRARPRVRLLGRRRPGRQPVRKTGDAGHGPRTAPEPDPQPPPGLSSLPRGAPEPVRPTRGDLRRAGALHRAVRVSPARHGAGVREPRRKTNPTGARCSWLPPGSASTLEGSDSPAAYESAAELKEDLLVVQRSLLRHGGERVARGGLRDFIRQVDTFGFHLARLDVRQESSRLAATVSELVAPTGEDYDNLDESGKVELLQRLLKEPDATGASPEDLSDETRDVLETFDQIKRAGDEVESPVETFVLSMARGASDVLAVQFLARRAGLVEVDDEGRCTENRLGVSPLFETVDDLEEAPEVLRRLLEDPFYRSALENGGICRRSCSATATRGRTRAT